MSGFVVVAGLLTVLALGFILPPLLVRRTIGQDNAAMRTDEVNLAVLRDQLRELDNDLAQGIIDASAHESARHELAQRVAQDVAANDGGGKASGNGAGARGQAFFLSVAVIAVAASLYAYLGNPAGLDPLQTAAPAANKAGAPQMSNEQITAMVAQLAERLKGKPDDTKGWAILARSYASMGRFAEANQAYAHLLELMPNDPAILTDAADAMAMSQGQSLVGEPEKLLLRALIQNPKEIKALILLGSAQFERHDYAAALASWQAMEVLLPPGSELASMAAGNIAQAQKMAAAAAAGASTPTAAGASIPIAAAPAPQVVPAVGASAVAGTLTLDAALLAHTSPTDTVFVFARAPAGGPRFPLAVLRKQVKDLPLSFVLDDTMSMMPDVKLSGFAQVVIGARISKSGNPIASAGDLEGASVTVAPGAKDLKILINTRRP
jgi:cytochrome c-type biogenesis protein CcmH